MSRQIRRFRVNLRRLPHPWLRQPQNGRHLADQPQRRRVSLRREHRRGRAQSDGVGGHRHVPFTSRLHSVLSF